MNKSIISTFDNIYGINSSFDIFNILWRKEIIPSILLFFINSALNSSKWLSSEIKDVWLFISFFKHKSSTLLLFPDSSHNCLICSIIKSIITLNWAICSFSFFESFKSSFFSFCSGFISLFSFFDSNSPFSIFSLLSLFSLFSLFSEISLFSFFSLTSFSFSFSLSFISSFFLATFVSLFCVSFLINLIYKIIMISQTLNLNNQI